MRKFRKLLTEEQIRAIRLLHQLGFSKYRIAKTAEKLYDTHLTTPYRHLNADPTRYRYGYTAEHRRERKQLVQRVMEMRKEPDITSLDIAHELDLPLRKVNLMIVNNL